MARAIFSRPCKLLSLARAPIMGHHGNAFRTLMEVLMNFDEMIRLHALKLKAFHRLGTEDMSEGGLQEQLFKMAADSPQARNICASISVQLFDQVEGACDMLGISKRRFVEAALIAAVDRASGIVAEVDPFAEVGGE